MSNDGQSAVGGRIDHRTSGRLLGLGLYGYLIAVMAFLWIPLVAIIVLSFAVNADVIFPFQGFTLHNYASTFADDALMGSLLNSVLIATVSATIATVLGLLTAFGVVRYDFPFKESFRTFAVLPMIIPGVILGIALLIFFRSLVRTNTGFLTIILTHSVYGFPFVFLPVTARLYSFDESLEEAARDLGAGQLTTFRDVTLPIIAPAVLAGFIFAFIRSFEDFIRVLFVRGPMKVLTISMYGMIKYGNAPKMNAISTFILFVMAVLLAVGMNIGDVISYFEAAPESDE